MASTQTKYIGTGTIVISISLLIIWFAGRPDFLVELSPNISCSGICIDPSQSDCVEYFNITSLSKKFYIRNKGNLNLPFTEPEKVRSFQIYKADKRFSSSNPNRWKPTNFSKSFTLDVNVTNEFRINLCKINSADTIKWGLEGIGINEDPIFFGYNISWIDGNEINTEAITRTIVSYNNQSKVCPSSNFSKIGNVAYCYNNLTILGNGSRIRTLNFTQEFNSYNISLRTVYWSIITKTDYVDYVNTSSSRHIGILVNQKIINFTKCGINCNFNNPVFQCDSCNGDSNCDGILNSGESGVKVDISQSGWYQNLKNFRIDNKNEDIIQKLRECV